MSPILENAPDVQGSRSKIAISKLDIRSLAEYVGTHLQSHGIEAILVGGACVSIYTHNKYVSYDLDLISYNSMSKIKKALAEIGFEYDKKKYFTHKQSPYFLEFVTPPVAVGDEPIHCFNTTKSSLGEIKILTPTDCVKDRLAAFIHWDDTQSLEQAVWVSQSQAINLDEIRRWASREADGDKISVFFEKIRDAKGTFQVP